MPGKRQTKHRSGCPVGIALDTIGDRWTLLVIRDLMVRGYRTFKEFRGSGEGIASNILSDRLRKLARAGIVVAEPGQADKRTIQYRLTEKGIGLAPVLLDLLIWGARHERTAAPCAFVEWMEANRAEVLAEARRRWEQHDPSPLIPTFRGGDSSPSRPSMSKSSIGN